MIKIKCEKCRIILDEEQIYKFYNHFTCKSCFNRGLLVRKCVVCKIKYLTFNKDSVTCRIFTCLNKCALVMRKKKKEYPLNKEEREIYKKLKV